MPKGIAIIDWNDEIGTVLRYIYPSSIELSTRDILQIYTSQTFGDIKNKRFSTFSTDNIKLASYYSGEETKTMLILLLTMNEIPDIFEYSLKRSYKKIFDCNIEDQSLIINNLMKKFEAISNTFKPLIKKIYNTIEQ